MGENPLDKPFEFISETLTGPEILKIIEGEKEEFLLHIIANINPKKSAEVLSLLPEEKRLDTIAKIAALKETTSETVLDIRVLLENRLKQARLAGGVTDLVASEILAKILSVSSDDVIKLSLEKLNKENRELAKETRKKLFLFEDIAALDNRTIGLILTNTNRDMLKLALKHAPEQVSNKIFETMSERGAAILKEDMEVMAEISENQSKEAQKSMLETVRQLEKRGILSLKRG